MGTCLFLLSDVLLAHKRVSCLLQSSTGMTGFLGRLITSSIGCEAGSVLPALVRDSESTMAGVRRSFATWWKLGQRAERTKGSLAYHQFIVIVFWTFPLECFIYSKLSASQTEILICTLPSKSDIAFLFFDCTVLSPFYHVFKIITLKSILTPSSPTYFPHPHSNIY